MSIMRIFKRFVGIWVLALMMPTCSALPAEKSTQIFVDLVGWRTESDRRVAIFANPIAGLNRGRTYHPGRQFQIRRVFDDTVVFTGKTEPWRKATMDPVSGDQVWFGDFSPFNQPGFYYILDPESNTKSSNFKIASDRYRSVLVHAQRVLYYQRCGTAIESRYGGNWVHRLCHAAQSAARPAGGSGLKTGLIRDVTGGFHDAGDYNKYSPYLGRQLYDLLTAYEIRPQAFGDDLNIPESGNGIPDLIDEIKLGLEWLLKMQDRDGGVFNRLVSPTYRNGIDDPSTDREHYVYTQKTTWATASFAAVAACAYRNFKSIDRLSGFAEKMLEAAESAWAYLSLHPSMAPSDGTDGAICAASPAGSDAGDDKRRRILAAAELMRATGRESYSSYFEKGLQDIAGTAEDGFHPLKNGFFDPAKTEDLVRACFSLARWRQANTPLERIVRDLFQATVDNHLVPSYIQIDDPYRAFMWAGHYSWGSNMLKSRWGLFAVWAVVLGINPERHELYKEIAEEYLHYLHGRNPLGLLYLSNMGEKGARLTSGTSIMQMFHYWFRDGSAKYDGDSSEYGPAPGYLAGGPNQFYSGSRIPPKGEPPMKAFLDWNNMSPPENSWEISEPSLSYQAAYISLLSHFCSR